jgi:hypothetical protein
MEVQSSASSTVRGGRVTVALQLSAPGHAILCTTPVNGDLAMPTVSDMSTVMLFRHRLLGMETRLTEFEPTCIVDVLKGCPGIQG